MQIQHSTLDLKQKAKKQYKYSILIFEKLVLDQAVACGMGRKGEGLLLSLIK